MARAHKGVPGDPHVHHMQVMMNRYLLKFKGRWRLPIALLKLDGERGPKTIDTATELQRAIGYVPSAANGQLNKGFERRLEHPLLRVTRKQRRRGLRYRNAIRAAARQPHVVGNTVTGGTPHERLVAAAEAARTLDLKGKRHSFYSQAGAWDPDHAITGPPSGHRSDCSQWVTGLFKAAGLPDPNGNHYLGGYTGTLADHGEEVTRAQAGPGCLVIWDPWGPEGHVDILVGPGQRTLGHGSTHIDEHTIDGMSAYKGVAPRFYRYV